MTLNNILLIRNMIPKLDHARKVKIPLHQFFNISLQAILAVIKAHWRESLFWAFQINIGKSKAYSSKINLGLLLQKGEIDKIGNLFALSHLSISSFWRSKPRLIFDEYAFDLPILIWKARNKPSRQSVVMDLERVVWCHSLWKLRVGHRRNDQHL